MRYTATFDFGDQDPPAVGANDGWLGGKIVCVSLEDCIVIPAADWKRLVELIEACGGRDHPTVNEIDALIQKVEAAND